MESARLLLWLGDKVPLHLLPRMMVSDGLFFLLLLMCYSLSTPFTMGVKYEVE